MSGNLVVSNMELYSRPCKLRPPVVYYAPMPRRPGIHTKRRRISAKGLFSVCGHTCIPRLQSLGNRSLDVVGLCLVQVCAWYTTRFVCLVQVYAICISKLCCVWCRVCFLCLLSNIIYNLLVIGLFTLYWTCIVIFFCVQIKVPEPFRQWSPKRLTGTRLPEMPDPTVK